MNQNPDKMAVRVLIACKDKGIANAERFAGIYNKIFDVEYNRNLNDFDMAFQYAQKENMSHILFFMDTVNLKLVSLLDDMGGYTAEVTIDDLEKVLSQNAYDNL